MLPFLIESPVMEYCFKSKAKTKDGSVELPGTREFQTAFSKFLNLALLLLSNNFPSLTVNSGENNYAKRKPVHFPPFS